MIQAGGLSLVTTHSPSQANPCRANESLGWTEVKNILDLNFVNSIHREQLILTPLTIIYERESRFIYAKFCFYISLI